MATIPVMGRPAVPHSRGGRHARDRRACPGVGHLNLDAVSCSFGSPQARASKDSFGGCVPSARAFSPRSSNCRSRCCSACGTATPLSSSPPVITYAFRYWMRRLAEGSSAEELNRARQLGGSHVSPTQIMPCWAAKAGRRGVGGGRGQGHAVPPLRGQGRPGHRRAGRTRARAPGRDPARSPATRPGGPTTQAAEVVRRGVSRLCLAQPGAARRGRDRFTRSSLPERRVRGSAGTSISCSWMPARTIRCSVPSLSWLRWPATSCAISLSSESWSVTLSERACYGSRRVWPGAEAAFDPQAGASLQSPEERRSAMRNPDGTLDPLRLWA